MNESGNSSLEMLSKKAMDVEFLPIVLIHKIHRNLKSSQVEIVPQPYYHRELTPEEEPEMQGEAEPEMAPPPVVYAAPLTALRERKNWWDFFKPIYSFNNQRVCARVERLMTSRLVQITDRKYWVKLQEKIKEHYVECLNNRIGARAADEVEREKSLLLKGKIPYEEAPLELKNHPVCRISQIAQKIIRYKTAKSKQRDKTSAYRTSKRRIRAAEKLLRKAENEIILDYNFENPLVKSLVCIVDAMPSEDVDKGLMFSQEDFDKLKYEDPLIKLLREAEAVNDMYDLAERIVGSTKLLADSKNLIATNQIFSGKTFNSIFLQYGFKATLKEKVSDFKKKFRRCASVMIVIGFG